MTGRSWTAIAVFALATSAFYLAVVAPDLAHVRPLAAESRRVTGRIIKVNWANREIRTYEYVVDGRSYTGETRDGPSLLGSKVTVYYRPSDPGHSIIGRPPGPRLEELVQQAWVVCPALGTLVALFIRWHFPRLVEYYTSTYERPRVRSGRGE